MDFFTVLKQFFDTFGNYITVPIIIFVICKIFRTPTKRAFQSAVLVGVGLMGMSFVTSAFGGVLTPLIQRMVDVSGISKPALDIGWQAVAAVCYSTDLGMMFIGVLYACQRTFMALGRTKLSLLGAMMRKLVILLPLCFVLPRLGYGTDGLLYAECIADVLGSAIVFAIFIWNFKSMLKTP